MKYKKPDRPYISDSDLVLASMNHKEAREFTGGYDKERIKLMREVKQKLHARDEFDALRYAKKKEADSPSIKESYLSQKQLEKYAVAPDSRGASKAFVADNKAREKKSDTNLTSNAIDALNKFEDNKLMDYAIERSNTKVAGYPKKSTGILDYVSQMQKMYGEDK